MRMCACASGCAPSSSVGTPNAHTVYPVLIRVNRYLADAPLQHSLDAVGDQMKSLKSELRQCLHSLRLALQAPERDTPVGKAERKGEDQAARVQAETANDLQRLQELVKRLEEQLRQRDEEVMKLQEKLRQHHNYQHHHHQQQQEQQQQQQQISTEHSVQIRFLRENLSHVQQQLRTSDAALAKLRRSNGSLRFQKLYLVKALAYSASFVSTVSVECAARDMLSRVPGSCLSPMSRLRACVFVIVAARRLAARRLLPAPFPIAAPLSPTYAPVDVGSDAACAPTLICAAAACDGAKHARSALQVSGRVSAVCVATVYM
jgi:hypothetical protein